MPCALSLQLVYRNLLIRSCQTKSLYCLIALLYCSFCTVVYYRISQRVRSEVVLPNCIVFDLLDFFNYRVSSSSDFVTIVSLTFHMSMSTGFNNINLMALYSAHDIDILCCPVSKLWVNIMFNQLLIYNGEQWNWKITNKNII